MSKTNFYKHESAYVDEGAVIGEGSKGLAFLTHNERCCGR